MPAPFYAFGTSHVLVLGITTVIACLLLTGRRRKHRWPHSAESVLGWAVFAAHFLALLGWLASGIPLTWENALPMHLCNWAGFAVWMALVFRNPTAAELAWFWAMAGTLQGLITPNQPFDWPHPSFFTFFLLHAGVVAGAIHAVFGMGLKPRAGAVWRGILWTEFYLLVAAGVNFLSGANYAFLRAKPAQASLMDHLGPWPWYLVSLQLIGIPLYFLLALPFRSQSTASSAPSIRSRDA